MKQKAQILPEILQDFNRREESMSAIESDRMTNNVKVKEVYFIEADIWYN